MADDNAGDPSGTATVLDDARGGRVEIASDGPCLRGTLDNLKHGLGAAPLPPESLVKARRDAILLLEDVVELYEAEVAVGEVGATGSRRATDAAPLAGSCPTGLLYGRVQSGKTLAMIAFTAAALDNGFRVVVVLTSDFVKLVEQTKRRFGALDGPLVKASTEIDTWQADAEHVQQQVADHGVVFVCAKNQAHLRSLVSFLDAVGAGRYPSVVFDDEADQATLDTTTSARAAQNPNAPALPSTIHRRTVANPAPGEIGESVREMLPHHVFLQVTATPYALLLQNVAHPLRPKFTRLLDPAVGYTGGETFFGQDHVDGDGRAPLSFVDEAESDAIQKGADEAPAGLKQALSFFLVASATQLLQRDHVRTQGQNFLCHTSHRTTEHDQAARLIRDYLAVVLDDLKNNRATGEPMSRLEWAHEELRRTLPTPPALSELLPVITRRLALREIPVVNSASSPVEFGPRLNFIVGGNILGRGLTIENLLVTYYIRRPKVSQMDTVLQHARMFGYRSALMPYTRVFLPRSLAFRFHAIDQSEQHLRLMLKTTDSSSPILVQSVGGLRPTRTNVLDTGSLSAYSPGQQVFPHAPALDRTSLSRNSRIETAITAAMGGVLRPSVPVSISIDQMIELLTAIPYAEDDAGNWDPETLTTLLLAIADRYQGQGVLRYREMTRERPLMLTAAASGDEVSDARAQNRPVLFLFRDTGRKIGTQFWYPTLVLPSDMPIQVFNVTR
jgi:hypothetical protein